MRYLGVKWAICLCTRHASLRMATPAPAPDRSECEVTIENTRSYGSALLSGTIALRARTAAGLPRPVPQVSTFVDDCSSIGVSTSGLVDSQQSGTLRADLRLGKVPATASTSFAYSRKARSRVCRSEVREQRHLFLLRFFCYTEAASERARLAAPVPVRKAPWSQDSNGLCICVTGLPRNSRCLICLAC
jgi:hypothetical protein